MYTLSLIIQEKKIKNKNDNKDKNKDDKNPNSSSNGGNQNDSNDSSNPNSSNNQNNASKDVDDGGDDTSHNNDNSNNNDSDSGSVYSTDMENANLDGLHMRIMYHKSNLDFCESVTDNLKTVKEYIQKTEYGTITEEESRKFEEMKSEKEVDDLIYKYDDEKSLMENVDKEIAQNEDRMKYIRERIELYEERADRVEAEEADSDSDLSSGNAYDVDFDEMDLDSDNEMDLDSDNEMNENNNSENNGNNNENSTEDNQSPTEYVAELESTLPGDFIGGGDD